MEGVGEPVSLILSLPLPLFYEYRILHTSPFCSRLALPIWGEAALCAGYLVFVDWLARLATFSVYRKEARIDGIYADASYKRYTTSIMEIVLFIREMTF